MALCPTTPGPTCFRPWLVFSLALLCHALAMATAPWGENLITLVLDIIRHSDPSAHQSATARHHAQQDTNSSSSSTTATRPSQNTVSSVSTRSVSSGYSQIGYRQFGQRQLLVDHQLDYIPSATTTATSQLLTSLYGHCAVGGRTCIAKDTIRTVSHTCVYQHRSVVPRLPNTARRLSHSLYTYRSCQLISLPAPAACKGRSLCTAHGASALYHVT